MAGKGAVNGVAKNEITVKNALKYGDGATKCSAIIFGAGNIAKLQVIKGLIYLALEIAFVVYMVTKGFGFLGDFFTLGTSTGDKVFNEAKQVYEYTQGDNSMLCLLYGLVTIFVILAVYALWRSSLKSAYQAQLLTENKKYVPTFVDDIRALFDQNIHKTLLALPITCVILFTILPLVFMISMAFTNFDRDHQPPGQLFDWVGFKNFAEIFNSGSSLAYAFWHILGWTLIWAVFATVLNFVLGMILAMVINRRDTKAKSFWRFIFVLSIAIPQFVSLLVMRTMLQPEGAINVLLKNMGFIQTGLPFWTDATWARVTVIVVNLWIGIPYTMLQTTGILKNIPAELYEAARIDGANAVTIFVKITMPYMLFVMTPYLITSFIGNINNFNVIYLLTAGAPAAMEYHNGTAGKTDLLVTWLYKLTIDLKDYNYGAVIGILVFIISATFSLIAYRNTGSYKNEEEFQ
ncbi:MAG: sugar ABC transporter permease [Lachnospiraceae bacterium]|nr:sugar ABC transporter permease [Lachnospiraceae bacterium]